MTPAKRARSERAIQRLEKTVVAHIARPELVNKILEDKNLSKTSDEIEKLRKKKLERAQKTIDNTKLALK